MTLQFQPSSRKLLKAVLADEPEEVELLLARRALLSSCEWPGRFTALHAAALSNCWRALPALLAAAAKEGLSIDCRLELPHSKKLLHQFLAKLGDLKRCELEHLYANTKEGMTPLQLACWEGNLEVVAILLAHGASAVLSCEHSLQFGHSAYKGDALTQLLYGKGSRNAGSLIPTLKLLLEHGANPLARKPGDSWRCYYVADDRLSLQTRLCLANKGVTLDKGRLHRLMNGGHADALIYSAGLCQNGAALLLLVRMAIQHRHASHLTKDGMPLLEALEAVPFAAAVLALQEVHRAGHAAIRSLLHAAVRLRRPKALHVILARNGPGGERAADLMRPLLDGADEQSLLHQYLKDIARVVNFLRSDPHLEVAAATVVALLTEAHLEASTHTVGANPSSRSSPPDSAAGFGATDLIDSQLIYPLRRRVRLALQQPAWSPAHHFDFPPAFQIAARAFLLAATASARRRSQQQQQQQQPQAGGQPEAGVQQAMCCLGDLPVPLLERVLGLAACPLSTWLLMSMEPR